MRKRYYIIFVARQEDGDLRKIPIPLHYAYVFVAAAVIGLFTITGLAGSYSRMLLKTARFNQIRTERETIRHDYLQMEQVAHEKDVQAASLGLPGERSKRALRSAAKQVEQGPADDDRGYPRGVGRHQRSTVHSIARSAFSPAVVSDVGAMSGEITHGLDFSQAVPGGFQRDGESCRRAVAMAGAGGRNQFLWRPPGPI